MKIDEIRIYFEVYEQGIDLMEYVDLNENLKDIPRKLVQIKGGQLEKYSEISTLANLREFKNFDAAITFISKNNEYPIFIIEYSTAVPTDDHIMQRYDGNYWSCFYNVSMIKISPHAIFNHQQGGGNRLKEIDHTIINFRNSGIYYGIDWPLFAGSDKVVANKERPSCPEFSNELYEIFNKHIEIYLRNNSIGNYYIEVFNKRKEEIESVLNQYSNPIFPNSPRIINVNKNDVEIKINRFGHSMDPEKGMIVFFSMMNKGNVIAKFIVEKSAMLDKRGDNYHSLFDAVSQYDNLMRKVEEYLEQNIKFDATIALDIFALASNSNVLFRNSTVKNGILSISDQSLSCFLENANNPMIVLLKFSKAIRLYGTNGLILEIRWSNEIVNSWLENKKSNKFDVISLNNLSKKELNEDLITYISKRFFQKLNFQVFSASYPSAQSDRSIIIGEGRKCTRDYVDLILIANDDENSILLQENKTFLKDSRADALKLEQLIQNQVKIQYLKNLINQIDSRNIQKVRIYIGVGGQGEIDFPEGVDYVLALSFINGVDFNCSLYASSLELMNYFTKISKQSIFKKIVISTETSISIVA